MNSHNNNPLKEFHISRKARDKYQFSDSLFSSRGTVVISSYHDLRVFAQKMNDKLDLISFPETAVKASDINAMGLIDEIFHYVIGLFCEQRNATTLKELQAVLAKRLGKNHLNDILARFVDEFPPHSVYNNQTDVKSYLEAQEDGIPNRQIVLEEIIMLWLANMNPAYSPYLELFDDANLERHSKYLQMINEVQDFFANQPAFGPDEQNLIDMLRAPAIAVPHSLMGQLEYILEKWGFLLGDFLFRILGGLDLLKEERKIGFVGPGLSRAYEYSAQEAERFSPDKDWMPKVVILAKSIYVWMDQLSKKYSRNIHRLDHIPDEELDQVADWGFTSLWLIGVWERSQASKQIKNMCGNPDAEASAYSLFDYTIARDLGGDEAYFSLKERAWARGVRLACDMVPNHTGIDSKWMSQHPDWFIAQSYSPFPAYSFDGENLSKDSGIGIYLENHYYNRTDAAVAFKRVDFGTGDARYVYHGNDGTSMPWNDTAQLNYLNPEVREAAIQTILHVARHFSVIRFDAAMTLTKKHYQRLWFPEPGTGGDIPSRSAHSMSRDAFDKAMPDEFWREVVDRVAAELPDTLLLAEAFWLMEGYFVRTLGMHRVYNSAFMNMLKNEENDKYRTLIKNTLEFNPEILKRFVNFMNNPDEETAIAQFGKDDKYFGVCLLLVTMPGLPLFGHGQIEGYKEKYGMEYRRAYWNESPDQDLVRRHQEKIFPVLRKRYLFADAQNFLLYDFWNSGGYVNENVFAYSNGAGNEHTLVVYNNQYESTSGWIRTSSSFLAKSDNGDSKLVQRSLAEGLSLSNDSGYYLIFRDHISGLEFIRSNQSIIDNGLFVELSGYRHCLFWDFREVKDNQFGHYSQLTNYLDGQGVPSVTETLKELFLQPLHHSFKELSNPQMVRHMIDLRIKDREAMADSAAMKEIEEKLSHFIFEAASFVSAKGGEKALVDETMVALHSSFSIPTLKLESGLIDSQTAAKIEKSIKNHFSQHPLHLPILLNWTFISRLGKLVGKEEFWDRSRSWIDEWRLGKIIYWSFRELIENDASATEGLALLKIITQRQNWFLDHMTEPNSSALIMEKLLSDPEVMQFLQINRYQDILWFNQEAFDLLLDWLFVIAAQDCLSRLAPNDPNFAKEITAYFEITELWKSKASYSKFQLEQFRYLLKFENPERPT